MTKSKKWIVYYKGITFKNNVLRVCPQLLASEVFTNPEPLYSPLAYQISHVAYVKTAENQEILNTAGDIIRDCLADYSHWQDLQGYANRSSYRLKTAVYYKSLAMVAKTRLLKSYPHLGSGSWLINACNNPFVTVSDKPDFCVRYENGICFNNIYKIDRNRFRTKRVNNASYQIIGKLYVILITEDQLEKFKVISLLDCHHQGQISLDPNFMQESEILIPGWLCADAVVKTIPLLYPDLDCDYHSIYQDSYGISESEFNQLKENFIKQTDSSESDMRLKNLLRQNLVNFFISRLPIIADQFIKEKTSEPSIQGGEVPIS